MDDHESLHMRQSRDRLLGDRFHRNRLPPAGGAISRDQHPGLGVRQALPDGLGAKTREERHGNRAELGYGQQRHRVFDHQRQVQPDRNATVDADGA